MNRFLTCGIWPFLILLTLPVVAAEETPVVAAEETPVLQPQAEYWETEFAKRKLIYLKSNTGFNGLTKDQLALFFFRLIEQVNFQANKDDYTLFLEKRFFSLPEAAEYLRTRERLVSDRSFNTLCKIFTENKVVFEAFNALVDHIAIDSDHLKKRKKYPLYLGEIEGVGVSLLSSEEIPAQAFIGSYKGEMALTMRRASAENPAFSDMYRIQIAPAHPVLFSSSATYLSLSAKAKGNEFRFMNSDNSATCNVQLMPNWIKYPSKNGEEIYRFSLEISAKKSILPGQQLLCDFTDSFLTDIEASGSTLVHFCGHCTQTLSPIQRVPCDKRKGCQLIYCSKSCQIQDKYHSREICNCYIEFKNYKKR